MNHNHAVPRRTAGAVRYSCGILFFLFTFCYLYFLQGYLLAEVQYVFSRGVTTYELLPGALVIACVLLAVQWIVARCVRTPDFAHALTYIPSFALLGALSDFSEQSIARSTIGAWMWIAPLMLAAFPLAVCAARRVEAGMRAAAETHDAAAVLWRNYLAMMAMMLLCGSFHADTDVYLYELKTERLILRGRYGEACRVGEKSLLSSRRLSNLRAHALAQQDLLGERLLDYPQEYGADGLLCVADTDARHYRFGADAICLSLGALCGRSVASAERYYELLTAHLQRSRDSLEAVDSARLAASDSLLRDHRVRLRRLETSERHLRDYRLCHLLLAKNLAAFRAAYTPDTAYADTSGGGWRARTPRVYREALAMAAPGLADTATLARYGDYRLMRDTLPDPVVRANLTRRKYGNTYWWYYDNR